MHAYVQMLHGTPSEAERAAHELTVVQQQLAVRSSTAADAAAAAAAAAAAGSASTASTAASATDTDAAAAGPSAAGDPSECRRDGPAQGKPRAIEAVEDAAYGDEDNDSDRTAADY
eukprot:COSAG01_NODE_1196_length_11303_cov_16.500714_4_plen_116_part_00